MSYETTYKIVRAMYETGNGKGLIAQWLDQVTRMTTIEASVTVWADHMKPLPFFSARQLTPIIPSLMLGLGLAITLPPIKSPTRLARELEKAGLPKLKNTNGTEYFNIHGYTEKLFIVERIHYWKNKKVSQDDIDKVFP